MWKKVRAGPLKRIFSFKRNLRIFGFFRQRCPWLTHEKTKQNNTSPFFFPMLPWRAILPNVASQFSKTRRKNAFPEELFPPHGFQICSTHCSSALAASHGMQKQNKCCGRLLVDAIMPTRFVSNHSTCRPIHGLPVHYTVDSSNPCATTPPKKCEQSPISRELRLARQKQASPMYSPRWYSHVDTLSADWFSVFVVLRPKGGILCFFLQEPARIKVKRHLSFEIENFGEIHLYKLGVMLRLWSNACPFILSHCNASR